MPEDAPESLDSSKELLAYPSNATLEEQRRAFVLQVIGSSEIAASVQAEAVVILAKVLETGQVLDRNERLAEIPKISRIIRSSE